MRKTVSIDTYSKIKKLFDKNPSVEFATTAVRDKLELDYFSVKLVLKKLLKEKFILTSKSKYKLRGI